MQHILRPWPLALLVAAGCVQQTAPVVSGTPDPRTSDIEVRKDEVLNQLAMCESGGTGESDLPIYDRRGAYVGRYQFSPRTVIAFVRQMDGRSLSVKEAIALAHDWRQASALAKYVIFERDGVGHWPACSRKLGLARQVQAIKSI